MVNVIDEDNLPEQNAIIIARWDIKGTNIKEGDAVFYLGEIPNMKGHIIFIHNKSHGECGTTGDIYCGYHPENFREAEEDEL